MFLITFIVFWWHKLWARLLRRSIYIDSEFGKDTNDGSKKFPLRTLAAFNARTCEGVVLRRDLRVVLAGHFETLTLYATAAPWVTIVFIGRESYWARRRRVARWRTRLPANDLPASIDRLEIHSKLRGVKFVGLRIKRAP